MAKDKQRIRQPEETGQIFMVDADGKVTALDPTGQIDLPDGCATFGTEKELQVQAADWSGNWLVEVWNKLPATKPVRKFTDRETAVRRIWCAVQNLPPPAAKEPRTGARSGSGPGTEDREAKQPAARRGSKTTRIIALLNRPGGATLKAIMALTGWQPHSVRGFISAQLSKRMGLKIQSFERDGERVYRIAPTIPDEVRGRRKKQ